MGLRGCGFGLFWVEGLGRFRVAGLGVQGLRALGSGRLAVQHGSLGFRV